MDVIKTKKEVRLLEFGTFYSLARNTLSGFNLKTRVEINIPASNRPKFRAGKQFC
jgi:nucleoid DNA-binding protein